MNAIVGFANVSFSYDGPLVLQDVDLEIGEREFLGIVGPNGGGKSTLLKLMLGLELPSAGRITVFGQTPQEGRARIGYCPQYPAFSRDFPISVQDAVLLGRPCKRRTTPEDRQVVAEVLEMTELTGLMDRRIGTLSGGQLQQLLIARALACEPALLVLDEPTANIDLRAEGDIFDLLKQLNQRMAIVVVTHDIGFISAYVTRIACLNRSLVCHQSSDLTGETITELYGGHVSMIDHIHS